MPSPVPGLAPGKYARAERERRFLLAGPPVGERPAEARKMGKLMDAALVPLLRHQSHIHAGTEPRLPG